MFKTIERYLITNNTDKFTKKSDIIFVSCLFYLIPALYIFFTPLRKNNFLVFISFLQVLLSVLSDYYYINHVNGPKLWLMDRSVAIIYALYTFYLLYNVRETLPFILIIIASFAIEYARESQNNDIWIKRHCIWHFVSSTVLLYGLFAIQNKK